MIRFVGLGVALLAGCECGPRLGFGEDPPLQVTPGAVSFAPTYVGAYAEQTLQVQNPSKRSRRVELVLSAPFSAGRAVLDLPAATTVELTLRFEPRAAGAFAATAVIGEAGVPVSGEGLAPLGCEAPVCRSARFDAFAGACVTAAEADGAPCTASHACFAAAECRQGTCVGTLTTCDDQNPCTVDACGEAGCVHLDGLLACPASANPCLAPSCDPATGCGFEPLPDGTECGGRDCTSADVCIGGSCVRRPAPQNQTCAEVVFGQPAGCAVVDGVGRHARIGVVSGVAFDGQGRLWFTDRGTLRTLDASGRVRTVAGHASASSLQDGVGPTARFRVPEDLAVDPHGFLLVSDVTAIRKASPSGVVTTLAGTAESRHLDGVGAQARFALIQGVALGPGGTLYVADGVAGPALGEEGRSRVRTVSPLGVVRTVWEAPRGTTVRDLAWWDGALYAGVPPVGVLKLDADGGSSTFSTACDRLARLVASPEGLACSPLPGNDVVRVLWDGGVGQVTRFSASTGWSVHAGIGADPDGGIWVGARPSGCGLFRIGRDGGIESAAGADLSRDERRPDLGGALAVAPDGALHFAEGSSVYAVRDGGALQVASAAGSITDLRWSASALLASMRSGAIVNLSAAPDGGAPVHAQCGTHFDTFDEGLTCIWRHTLPSLVVVRVMGDGGEAVLFGDAGVADGPHGIGQLRRTTDIVSDRDGGAFIADFESLRHLSAANVLSTPVANLGAPSPSTSLALGPEGTLFVAYPSASSPGVLKAVSGGQLTTVAQLSDAPLDLAVEDAGSVLVSVPGGILRIRR